MSSPKHPTRSSTSVASLRSALDSTKSDILTELRLIQQSLSNLDAKVKGVEQTLSAVLETQKRQDAEMKILKADIQRLKEEKIDVFDEIEDRNWRRTNLILTGLPESEQGSVDERRKSDTGVVETLFEALITDFNCDAITKVHRIGKVNSPKPRLLRIVCRDVQTKRSLLLKAKNLRTKPEYAKVFLNPDLTPTQQKESKRLREELKRRRRLGEDATIRYGKIVTKQSSQNFH